MCGDSLVLAHVFTQLSNGPVPLCSELWNPRVTPLSPISLLRCRKIPLVLTLVIKQIIRLRPDESDRTIWLKHEGEKWSIYNSKVKPSFYSLYYKYINDHHLKKKIFSFQITVLLKFSQTARLHYLKKNPTSPLSLHRVWIFLFGLLLIHYFCMFNK